MDKEGTLRQHTLWMISGHGLSLIFQAGYFVLIGRTLGSLEYGAFAGVVALINVLSQCSSLGMEMILVRNISRNRESFAATWGSALKISLCGFFLILLVSMSLAHFTLKPQLRALVPFIAVSDALLGKFAVLAGRAFQGAGQLSQTARLTALTNIARAIAAAGLFLFVKIAQTHADAALWTKIYWLSSLATATVAMIEVTRHLGWPKFTPIRLRDLTDGLSFSLSSSSISIYNDIDKTILAGAGQLYAAGIYAAAYRIIDVASIPIYAAYTAASPHFFREGDRSIEQARALANRLLRRTIPYGFAIAFALFVASPLLPHIFGSSFRGSIFALRWLCFLPLIRGLHYAWGTTITGSASQWYRTAAQASAAVINLLLNLALIPRWSWQGAAAASLLTDSLLAAACWLIVQYLRNRQSNTRTEECVQAL